ncbi:FeoC-like transcriptional regulator [Clostridium sp.]|uniref:FeoC-like transcriptional regulator n=1 Tax=Clostridium sp. TaxID=1506 RepID=UPI00359F2FBE
MAFGSITWLFGVENIFNQGETYSLEDIANMLKVEVNTVKAQLEYLENNGYIRKVIGGTNCNTDCTRCRNKNGNRGGLRGTCYVGNQ